jgi:hypothetical protein
VAQPARPPRRRVERGGRGRRGGPRLRLRPWPSLSACVAGWVRGAAGVRLPAHSHSHHSTACARPGTAWEITDHQEKTGREPHKWKWKGQGQLDRTACSCRSRSRGHSTQHTAAAGAQQLLRPPPPRCCMLHAGAGMWALGTGCCAAAATATPCRAPHPQHRRCIGARAYLSSLCARQRPRHTVGAAAPPWRSWSCRQSRIGTAVARSKTPRTSHQQQATPPCRTLLKLRRSEVGHAQKEEREGAGCQRVRKG